MESVKVIFLDLPRRVRGFSVLGPDGSQTVVLNARLTQEMHVHTYLHEETHFECDDFSSDENVDILETIRHLTQSKISLLNHFSVNAPPRKFSKL